MGITQARHMAFLAIHISYYQLVHLGGPRGRPVDPRNKFLTHILPSGIQFCGGGGGE